MEVKITPAGLFISEICFRWCNFCILPNTTVFGRFVGALLAMMFVICYLRGTQLNSRVEHIVVPPLPAFAHFCLEQDTTCLLQDFRPPRLFVSSKSVCGKWELKLRPANQCPPKGRKQVENRMELLGKQLT